jgi:hypothetical protein
MKQKIKLFSYLPPIEFTALLPPFIGSPGHSNVLLFYEIDQIFIMYTSRWKFKNSQLKPYLQKSDYKDIYYSKNFATLIFLSISTNNINTSMSTLYKNKEVNMFFQLFNFIFAKF